MKPSETAPITARRRRRRRPPRRRRNFLAVLSGFGRNFITAQRTPSLEDEPGRGRFVCYVRMAPSHLYRSQEQRNYVLITPKMIPWVTNRPKFCARDGLAPLRDAAPRHDHNTHSRRSRLSRRSRHSVYNSRAYMAAIATAARAAATRRPLSAAVSLGGAAVHGSARCVVAAGVAARRGARRQRRRRRRRRRWSIRTGR